MKRRHILILLIVILTVMPYSCTRMYYTDYPGKVTKGYKKPPKEWKKPKSRYLEPKKKYKSEKDQGTKKQ